jgi:aspartyl-tRNA(Asn)/glutamyl-tRNA(Gln) amidotransferase subunit A
VESLRARGAVIVGSTVLPEFALGLDIPATRNAWDHRRHPGGSSSGSAVSVAVGSAFAALGTDTGGSVRIPAAANGVVGLKPTRGAISRRGTVPLCQFLDTVGPITRTVEDCRIMFEALVGSDPGDPATRGVEGRYGQQNPDAGIAGLRMGVDERILDEGVNPEVSRAVRSSLEQLVAQGVVAVPVELARFEPVVTAAMVMILAEMGAWHLELLRTRAGEYGVAVRRFLEAGVLIPALTYLQAHQTRVHLTDTLANLYDDARLDVVVLPTLPQIPPVVSADEDAEAGEDSLRFKAGAVEYTTLANLTGWPALTIPCGRTHEEMPIGLQLMGRPFAEGLLFLLGDAVEDMSSSPRSSPLEAGAGAQGRERIPSAVDR